MKVAIERITPYNIISGEDIPALGLWRSKTSGFQCIVVGVISAKDLFNAIPTYKSRNCHEDEQILVLASCVTSKSPELTEEDYIPSISAFTLQDFKKNYREDISAQFVSGPLATALASMYI